MEVRSSSKCFGGEQRVYAHASRETACEMKFAAFLPPGEGPFPALFWLSGLTCTEENFIIKSGAQRVAAGLGMVLIAPDTSPRGVGVPDDSEGVYDFGLGAGFYVDATAPPWSRHYRMKSYVEDELYRLALETLPIDPAGIGVFGHSMGGHGALTVALRNPDKFKTVSAFAPIVSPMKCPWGEKALSNYLGKDRAAWREYDACALIEDGARVAEILVEQGDKDPYLEEQLKPRLLDAACKKAGLPLTLRMRAGYDHSYYFISTFMEDHLRWHKERLV